MTLYGADVHSDSAGNILCILHILRFLCIYLFFLIYPVFLQLCSSTAAHNDCSAIFKSAAWYALLDRLDEEVDGILSCRNPAVLTAYIDGLIKTSVLLWK